MELAGSLRRGVRVEVFLREPEKMPEELPDFFRSFLLVRSKAELERAAEGVSE